MYGIVCAAESRTHIAGMSPVCSYVVPSLSGKKLAKSVLATMGRIWVSSGIVRVCAPAGGHKANNQATTSNSARLIGEALARRPSGFLPC